MQSASSSFKKNKFCSSLIKTPQNRQGFLFRGFMCLWLRNSGLRPSNNLAITAHFISRNDAILSDVLLMPLPGCYNYAQLNFIILFHFITPPAQQASRCSFVKLEPSRVARATLNGKKHLRFFMPASFSFLLSRFLFCSNFFRSFLFSPLLCFGRLGIELLHHFA